MSSDSSGWETNHRAFGSKSSTLRSSRASCWTTVYPGMAKFSSSYFGSVDPASRFRRSSRSDSKFFPSPTPDPTT